MENLKDTDWYEDVNPLNFWNVTDYHSDIKEDVEAKFGKGSAVYMSKDKRYAFIKMADIGEIVLLKDEETIRQMSEANKRE